MTDSKTDINTILKTLSAAKRVAVVLPEQVNIDLFAAAAAFAGFLKQSVKQSTVFSSAKTLPSLPFLKDKLEVFPGMNDGTQLAIKISNSHAQLSELRYDKGDDGITLYITPKEGQFMSSDVSVLPSAANFDLVVIIGAANFEQLGDIYNSNTKLFFETPHINIDINPANEFFGTVNFVPTTASSLSEAVMDILEAQGSIDENIATALLAGIISQTSSFRDPKTTPESLLKASRLVTAGARQQDIIQYLYKTKPLPLLQLWGRALARLTASTEKQVLTAVVTKSDLEKTQVGVDQLPIVVKDIIEMISGYSLIFFLAELPNGVQVVAAGLPFEDLQKVMADLQGGQIEPKKLEPANLTGKYQYLTFWVKQDLPQIQEKLNKIIESRQSMV
jgi:nanoRNase/pAp phosphatase (c-di-AMP/oligoRNAs hydrolase)